MARAACMIHDGQCRDLAIASGASFELSRSDESTCMCCAGASAVPRSLDEYPAAQRLGERMARRLRRPAQVLQNGTQARGQMPKFSAEVLSSQVAVHRTVRLESC